MPPPFSNTCTSQINNLSRTAIDSSAGYMRQRFVACRCFAGRGTGPQRRCLEELGLDWTWPMQINGIDCRWPPVGITRQNINRKPLALPARVCYTPLEADLTPTPHVAIRTPLPQPLHVLLGVMRKHAICAMPDWMFPLLTPQTRGH
jgi:hypothetical protein